MSFFATQTFVLLPAHSRAVSRSLSSAQHLGVAACVVLLTASMLLVTVSKLLAGCYLLGILTITVACPWLLVHMQHARTQIHGPWDAAVRAFLQSQAQSQRPEAG